MGTIAALLGVLGVPGFNIFSRLEDNIQQIVIIALHFPPHLGLELLPRGSDLLLVPTFTGQLFPSERTLLLKKY